MSDTIGWILLLCLVGLCVPILLRLIWDWWEKR